MDQKKNFFLSTKSNFLTQFKSTYLRGPRYSMPHISRSYFFLCILNSLFFFEKYLTSIHIQRVPALPAFWDLEICVSGTVGHTGLICSRCFQNHAFKGWLSLETMKFWLLVLTKTLFLLTLIIKLTLGNIFIKMKNPPGGATVTK